MDLKFSDLVDMLSEDASGQQAYGDKWATGISGRNQGTQQLSIVDMLKQGQMSQHPNKVKASPGLPHSTQNMVQLLGDLFLHIDQVKQSVQVAAANPILDERPGALDALERMAEKLTNIQKSVTSIGKDIDDFSIDPSKKEPKKKKSGKSGKEKKEHFKKIKDLEK
jgi:hypothetical protein